MKKMSALIAAAGKAIGALRANADALFREVIAFAGAGLIVYGVGLMHVPSAYILGGIFLLIVAWGRTK